MPPLRSFRLLALLLLLPAFPAVQGASEPDVSLHPSVSESLICISTYGGHVVIKPLQSCGSNGGPTIYIGPGGVRVCANETQCFKYRKPDLFEGEPPVEVLP